MNVNKIDINSFSKDLIYYKNKIFKEYNVTDEFDINIDEINDINNTEFNLGENNNLNNSIEESVDFSDEGEKYYDKIKGIVKTINYLSNYSKKKEKVNNEKYIIFFTDIINIKFTDEDKLEKNMENLVGDEDTIFLIVGKMENIILKNEKSIIVDDDKKLAKKILNKFGEKSEIIAFENMKKIKTILSNNNVIKDEIIYPNEIYK